MTRSVAAAWLVAAVSCLITVAPSKAAFPGRNGPLLVLHDIRPPVSPCTPMTPGDCPAVFPAAQRQLTLLRANGGIGGHRSLTGATLSVAASPDGRRIAYDGNGIWVGDMTSGDPRPIVGFGLAPAWSPDGRQLAFVSDGQIWVVNRDGHGLRLVTTTRRYLSSPAWSPDGRTIAFVSSRNLKPGNPRLRQCGSLGTVKIVAATGGRPRILFKPDLRCPMVSSVDWAPDGRRLVITVNNAVQEDTPSDPKASTTVGVNVVAADGGHPRRVARRGDVAVWSPDGRFLATRDRSGICPASRPDPNGEICVRIMRPDGRHSHAIANLQEAIGAGLSFGWAASPP